MILRSRSPVRVDFAGGWTDVALFCNESPGYVINAALNVYSYATLVARDNHAERSINIYSSDLDEYVEARIVPETTKRRNRMT